MDAQRRAVVIGNINMDLVHRGLNKLPEDRMVPPPDAGDPEMLFGGKGANQAVAAAKMGAQVTLIGCVGQDNYGDFLLAGLRERAVNVDHVVRHKTEFTGTVLICIDKAGNPSFGGKMCANFALTAADVHARHDVIAAADVLILQNGVPGEALLAARQIAREADVPVIFNPAPHYYPMPADSWHGADWLIPNAEEAMAITATDNIDAAILALRLLARNTAITRGADGVLAFGPQTETSGVMHVGAHPITQIDAVGASDCWIGAFACRIGNEDSVRNAIRFANIAAALACTKPGAMDSFPTLGEVLEIYAP